MISVEQKKIARAAAAILESEMPASFIADVEALLSEEEIPQTYMNRSDAIALASLLVNLSMLALMIHSELKAKVDQPPAHVIERKIEIKLLEEGVTIDTKTKRIIEVVINETVKESQ
nr:hypothetical protein [uncultured Cohaesibacter sp.]